MTFEEVYQLPFRNDYGIYGKTANHITAFNFLFDDQDLQDKVISILNNEEETTNILPMEYDPISSQIFLQAKPILLIRGWGYLTGVGGLHLSAEDAMGLQAQLAQYIISRLTKSA